MLNKRIYYFDKKTIILFLAVTILTVFSKFTYADSIKEDYSKAKKLDLKFNYLNLGPIGAEGYPCSIGDKKSCVIMIKQAYKDGPAAGKLNPGDIIIGVTSPKLPKGYIKSKLFIKEVKESLSIAITEAEKKENKGNLSLYVWRKGKKITVKLKLKTLGSYSSTTPHDCQKTDNLIDNAVQAILKNGSMDPRQRHKNMLTASLNGLALLATGDKAHWKTVHNLIKRFDSKSIEDYRKQRAWFTAYQNLLVTEYYLATKDKSVLPIIKKISYVIAHGRSGVGTWSHGIANPQQNHGKPFGIACAYGAMNQVTLTCALSLVLAKKCGVQDELIDTAIEKSTQYLRFYVDKGNLPYGDHIPGPKHDNNGSSSQAAVLYSIMGDKEAAEFYTKMSLASKRDRERGHTGPFFNRLWGPLGAACGGRHASIEFNHLVRWRTELQRLPSGGFKYIPAVSREDKGKYRNWDTTGARLLMYCLPRKKLYITGKGGSPFEAFSKEEAKEIVQTSDIKPDGKSKKELLKQIKHWSPVIRKAAAIELGKKGHDVKEELYQMLSSDDKYAQYGAALASKYAGKSSDKLLNKLIKLTEAKTMTMRYYALLGLTPLSKRGDKETYPNGLQEKPLKAIPHLFKILVKDYPDEYRPWTKTYITYTLFGGNGRGLMKKESWDDMTSKEKVDVIRKMLKLDNGQARSAMSAYYKYLTKKEIAQLLPEIYEGVRTPAPSGVMFNKAVRSNGLAILAKNNIKEGLQLGMDYMFEYGHGGYARRTSGIGAIKYYGKHLPKDFVDKLEKAMKKTRGNHIKKAIQEMRSTPAPKLIPMKDFIKKHK